MTTAAEALQALAADPHYAGGTLGILAVLHTWTRALVYHPHVHCLVPAAALASDRRTWRSPRGNFLVPVRALSVRFRARFLARLQAALPDAVVPAAVWQKPWVVYCKPTVQGSALVLRYLARYVHRVAISNARVQRVTGDQVTFSYKDAEARTWRRMTLSADEFLRRFLQHVLPRGFHKVRYYGLWRPTAAGLRAALHQHLLPTAPPSCAPTALIAPVTAPPTAGDRASESGASAPVPTHPPLLRCPACARGYLHVVARIPRAPPAVAPTGIPP
jgi:hypothetical protein